MCDRGNDYPWLLILFMLQVIFFKRFAIYSIIFCLDPFNTNTLILLLITYFVFWYYDITTRFINLWCWLKWLDFIINLFFKYVTLKNSIEFNLILFKSSTSNCTFVYFWLFLEYTPLLIILNFSGKYNCVLYRKLHVNYMHVTAYKNCCFLVFWQKMWWKFRVCQFPSCLSLDCQCPFWLTLFLLFVEFYCAGTILYM